MTNRCFTGLLTVVLLTGKWQYTHAQLVFNGTEVSISEGAIVYVDGNIQYESGSIQNKGRLLLTGGWKKNGEGEMFSAGSDGTVELAGTAVQAVSGKPVVFPKLVLSGNSRKELLTDLNIGSELAIGDQVLDIGDHRLVIENPSVTALTRGKGKIATNSGGGQLVQTVKAGSQYTFPLGTRDQYRPIICKTGADGRVTAQFLPYDPNQDQYDRNAREANIGAVNGHFYHKIEKAGAVDELTCSIPFSSRSDGDFESMARWNGNRWQLVQDATIGSFTDPADAALDRRASFIVRTGTGDSAAVLALASLKTIPRGELRIPNVFTPNSDGVNETFVIPGLEQYAENELRIFNRWGNQVYGERNYTNKWRADGLHDGTYFYWLRVKLPGGTYKIHKGWVTVLH